MAASIIHPIYRSNFPRDRYLELNIIILRWAMLPFFQGDKSIKNPAQKKSPVQKMKANFVHPIVTHYFVIKNLKKQLRYCLILM